MEVNRHKKTIEEMVLEASSLTNREKSPSQNVLASNMKSGSSIQKPPVSDLTLRQIVTNPAGSGSAYLGRRSAIIADLSRQFITALRNYRKQFVAQPYIFNDGTTIFKMKVPSTDYKHNGICYDVLIEIQGSKEEKRLSARPVRVFSNSMSFIYTYAYVFNKKGLMIDQMKSFLPIECITLPPVIRNPVLSLGFEKSLYFAARYLIDGFCLTPEYLRKTGIIADQTVLSKLYSAENAKIIETVYQHSAYLQRKTHRKKMPVREKKDKDKLSKNYERSNKNTIQSMRNARSKITARKLNRIYNKR